MNMIIRVMCVALMMVVCSFSYDSTGALEITSIDVHEGEAMFIITPSGKTILIDTGNLITGYDVYSFLKERDIDTIDHLIITHPHPDHMGGVFLMQQALTIHAVYDNGQLLSEDLMKQPLFRWYEELVRHHPHYSVLARDDVLEVDGMIVTVLWPPEIHVFDNFNNNSLALRISYNYFTLIQAGDMQINAEAEVLARTTPLKGHILKVAHHGYHDASSIEFLKAVNPELSIISIDANNHRGYPSAKVIDRLLARGSKVLQTSTHGNIAITVQPDGTYSITTEKEFPLAA